MLRALGVGALAAASALSASAAAHASSNSTPLRSPPPPLPLQLGAAPTLVLTPRALDGAAGVLHLEVGVPAAAFTTRVRAAFRRALSAAGEMRCAFVFWCAL